MGKSISKLNEDIKLDHDLLRGTRHLTFEEKRILANRVMKKHGVAGVTLHWVNAISWFLLIFTGAALISADYLKFTPNWYLDMMMGIFGTKHAMLHFHIAIGVFWITTLFLYGVFGYKNYLIDFVKHDLILNRDDIKWFPAKAKNLAGKLSHYDIAYAVVVALSTVTLIITGPVMAFHIGPEIIIQWAMMLHFLATMSVFAGIFVHVYMAALFPEERPAFFSMITGKVNELYAYLHHYKWWKEIKNQEHEFFAEELAKDGVVLPELQDCKNIKDHVAQVYTIDGERL
ncbi:MAG: cytochrome b/b6 domain-containing protein [Ignavibacteriaceae bacterium]